MHTRVHALAAGLLAAAVGLAGASDAARAQALTPLTPALAEQEIEIVRLTPAGEPVQAPSAGTFVFQTTGPSGQTGAPPIAIGVFAGASGPSGPAGQPSLADVAMFSIASPGGAPACVNGQFAPAANPRLINLPSPDEMFGRVAQNLGISPDRLREAVRQSVPPPSPPPSPPDDVLARIAQGLGVPVERVRQAFTEPDGCGFTIPFDPSVVPGPTASGGSSAPLGASGPAAALSQRYTERTNAVAQALGVSGDRLREVLRQTLRPPRLMNLDDAIGRLAQNLGVTPERLRQAMRVPLPDGGEIVWFPLAPRETAPVPPRR